MPQHLHDLPVRLGLPAGRPTGHVDQRVHVAVRLGQLFRIARSVAVVGVVVQGLPRLATRVRYAAMPVSPSGSAKSARSMVGQVVHASRSWNSHVASFAGFGRAAAHALAYSFTARRQTAATAPAGSSTCAHRRREPLHGVPGERPRLRGVAGLDESADGVQDVLGACRVVGVDETADPQRGVELPAQHRDLRRARGARARSISCRYSAGSRFACSSNRSTSSRLVERPQVRAEVGVRRGRAVGEQRQPDGDTVLAEVPLQRRTGSRTHRPARRRPGPATPRRRPCRARVARIPSAVGCRSPTASTYSRPRRKDPRPRRRADRPR